MTFDYDKLYKETPNALGAPSPAFVAFFEQYNKTGAFVLDVGCGQGRDALATAGRGHRVVGVDWAPAGIAAMLQNAEILGLELEGVVADIRDYYPDRSYDIILIDRTLHMLERTDRLMVLQRLVGHVAAGGHLLIADEKPNLRDFQDILEKDSRDWIVTLQKSTLFAQVGAA